MTFPTVYHDEAFIVQWVTLIPDYTNCIPADFEEDVTMMVDMCHYRLMKLGQVHTAKMSMYDFHLRAHSDLDSMPL